MNKNINADAAIKAVKVRSQPQPEKRSCSISRRLSRQESTMSYSGREIFYGDSPVSIPFQWESTPGTPKVDLSERRPMPPLTPPPSYLSSPARLSVKKQNSETGEMYSRYSHSSSSSSNGILHNVILPKLNLKKKSKSDSPSSLSSSSCSSSSSVSSFARSIPSTPESAGCPRRKLAYHLRRKEEDEEEEEEGESGESHIRNLCFGIPGRNHSSKRGCSANFIKLLLKQHA